MLVHGLIMLWVNGSTSDEVWRLGSLWLARDLVRYLALINLGGLILCAIAIRRRLPCAPPKKGESSLVYFQNRNFNLIYCGCFLSTLGMFMPYTHLPLYAKLHGVSTGQAVFLLSVMGIASTAGRIVVGFLADHFSKLAMLKTCMLAGGCSTLCWMACKEYYSMAIYGSVFGFFAGGIISIMPAVSADQFGIKNLASVMGLLFTSTAIGNLLSAPIAGFLHDAYQTYYYSIIFAGGTMICGCVIVQFVHDVHDTERNVKNVDTATDSTNSSNKHDDDPSTTVETYGNYYTQIDSSSGKLSGGDGNVEMTGNMMNVDSMEPLPSGQYVREDGSDEEVHDTRSDDDDEVEVTNEDNRDSSSYRHLMNEQDHESLKWVLEFNQFDLYTKDQAGLTQTLDEL
eukprot:gene27072-33742_t